MDNSFTWKKAYAFLFLILLALVTVSYAAVPQSTPADTIQTFDNNTQVTRTDILVIDRDIFYVRNDTYINTTAAIEALLGLNATNEWGVVFGTTGDWFDYQEITANPVYINVHMHPLNETISSIKVYPQVYDKDATHWQLALYWQNGTQCNHDCLVMYYAHVEWDDADGLQNIVYPNEEQT